MPSAKMSRTVCCSNSRLLMSVCPRAPRKDPPQPPQNSGPHVSHAGGGAWTERMRLHSASTTRLGLIMPLLRAQALQPSACLVPPSSYVC